MSQLTFDLEPDQMRRLDELAAAERTSPQSLAREAVDRLLAERGARTIDADADDPYAPLRAIIGMIEHGPTDSSIYHDGRPGGSL